MLRQKARVVLLICLPAVLLSIPFALGIQEKKAFTTDNLVNSNIIRLHVIANSDRQADQEVKYMVRDRIIRLLRQELISAKDYQEARKMIIANRARIAAAAGETVADAGYSYAVDVKLCRSDFPTKAYGNVVLPQGEYEALKVTLGEAQGANWWCVLFPPLCFVDISGTAMENREDSIAVQETLSENGKDGNESWVDLRFRLLEWLHRDDGYLAKDKSEQ